MPNYPNVAFKSPEGSRTLASPQPRRRPRWPRFSGCRARFCKESL